MEQQIEERTADASFQADQTIEFPAGLPGFKQHTRFTLSAPAELAPLACLQSQTVPFPRFFLLPARSIDRAYRLHMESWDRALLYPSSELAPGAPHEGVSLYFVISIANDAVPTVNMLAPIVIRPEAKLGVQAVRSDSVYSHAAPIVVAEVR